MLAWPGSHAVCNIKSCTSSKVKCDDRAEGFGEVHTKEVGHLSLAMNSVVVQVSRQFRPDDVDGVFPFFSLPSRPCILLKY